MSFAAKSIFCHQGCFIKKKKKLRFCWRMVKKYAIEPMCFCVMIFPNLSSGATSTSQLLRERQNSHH